MSDHASREAVPVSPENPVELVKPQTTEVRGYLDNHLALLQAAIQRGVGSEDLERLMGLKERAEDRAAKMDFHAAMAACQGEIPIIGKTSTAGGRTKRGAEFKYQYADLAEIMAALREPMKRNGLAVNFLSKTEDIGGKTFVTEECVVSHVSGHSAVCGTATVPIDFDASMNVAQKFGSAKAYARRYAVKDAFNIVEAGEDTDATNPAAQSPSGPPVKRSAPRRSKASENAMPASKGPTLAEAGGKLRAAMTLAELEKVWGGIHPDHKAVLKSRMQEFRNGLLAAEVSELTMAIQDCEDEAAIREMLAGAHKMVATRVQDVVKERLEELAL